MTLSIGLVLVGLVVIVAVVSFFWLPFAPSDTRAVGSSIRMPPIGWAPTSSAATSPVS